MAWTQARDQIVKIVKETAVLTTKRGFPTSFKHAPEASDDNVPGSRSFWLMPKTKAMVGALSIALPRRFRYEVNLAISYDDDKVDPTILAEVMASDHEALCARLPDTALWNRPVSTIESLFLGDALVLRAELVELAGAIVDVYTFHVEFTSA